MILLIDLSKNDAIHLALFDKDSIEHKNYSGRNRELLASINSFFDEQKLKKEDLKGIMIVIGSGSFTNTRISAVVANTFGYVLNIPLLAITKEQIKNVQELISDLLKQPKGQYISASYSAEPNIG